VTRARKDGRGEALAGILISVLAMLSTTQRARSSRATDPNATTTGAGAGAEPASEKPRYWTWAALMRRAFDIDVLRCPHCAGRMRLIATIEDPAVIARILAHLGLSGSRDGPGPAPPSAAPPAEQHALPHAII